MDILTRRSVLRASLGVVAAGSLVRPYIANAQAKTLTAWFPQGFVPEEDEALKQMCAEYEKLSGNKVDYSIIPFAPLRQKSIAAIQSGVVPDIMNTPDLEFAPLNSWDDKFLDVSDIVESQKKDFAPIAIDSCFLYNGVTKKRGYTVVPLRINGVPFHIWRPLVEKAGFKISDLPNTWDAFLDFFMPVQDKLRADGMRNIYAYGYQLTANGVDPIATYNAFLIAYGGKGLVTPDGRLNTGDQQVSAAAAKAIEKLTTPFKKGYVPPGVVNWNDADDNNAFHAKLMVMDFDGTISTEVALYHDKEQYDDILTHGLPLSNDRSFFWFIWVLVFGAVWIGQRIDRSSIGRALRAIAASEQAAASVGIDITRHKVQMFVIGGGMASVSGSLLVHYLRATDPSVFSFGYSINLITGTIIGGLTSIWGGALGAAIIIFLRELLRELELPLWESVIMGALTVLVLIVFPRGIAGFVSRIYDRVVGGEAPQRVVVTEPGTVALPAMSDPPALMLEGVSRSFGNLRAVSGVGFAVPAGSITALIGPNGAGKTTLFNLISGHLRLDAGKVRFDGREIQALEPRDVARLGIGRTFQNLQLFDNMTVLQNVMCGHHRFGGAGAEKAARDALAFVGLQGAESHEPASLPFGHQRLVEIARAMALRPRMLLMDEPASGLNDAETERLSELIVRVAALGVTVLLVEHDMRLVMGLADHVVVMDHGEKIAEGAPEPVRADPGVIAAYLGQEIPARAA